MSQSDNDDWSQSDDFGEVQATSDFIRIIIIVIYAQQVTRCCTSLFLACFGSRVTFNFLNIIQNSQKESIPGVCGLKISKTLV